MSHEAGVTAPRIQLPAARLVSLHPFLDADDWYLTGCFDFDREAFTADPALGIVRHSLGYGWDPDDEAQSWFVGYTGSARARARFHSRVDGVSPSDYFYSLYPLGNVGSGVAGVVTLRKALAESVGGFPRETGRRTSPFTRKSGGRAARRLSTWSYHGDAPHPCGQSQPQEGEGGQRTHRPDRELSLDVADFAKSRRLPWRIQIALHQGWLRFAQQYTRHRSFAMLQKCPGALLAPRVAWGYCRFYTAIARFAAGRVWRTARQRLRAW